MTHWQFNNKPVSNITDVDPSGKSVGFVYQIFNKDTKRVYIGRKNWFTKSGKGRKPREDWKSYCGSSGWLKEDIKHLGKSKFRFEICHTADNSTRLKMLEVYNILYYMLYHPNGTYNRSAIINIMNYGGSK